MAVSGGLMGLAHALVAYGFQLTYAAGKAVNFGQGELVMLGAFAGISLTGLGLPYWLSLAGAMVIGAALGWLMERVAVRLALQQHNEGWILLTIIVGLFGVSAAENIWGRDDLPYPAPWPDAPLDFFGISVTWPGCARRHKQCPCQRSGSRCGISWLKLKTITGIAGNNDLNWH